MIEFTKQQMREALRKLPEEVQDIILSEERSETLNEIMEKHHLTVGEMGGVVDALAPISFGLVHPNELPARIRKALPGFDSAKVDALIKDLNEKMLAPIRAHVMESVHHEKDYIPTPTDSTPAAIATGATPPPPANLPTAPTAVQTKLEQPFRLAPDNVVIKKPSLSSSVEKGVYPKGADPYREPIS